MSGRRFATAAALAALAALTATAPALAEPGHTNERTRVRSAGARVVITPRYFGHPLGFYRGWGWGGFWNPGPWYFYDAWPGPGYSYSLEPAVPADQVLVTVHVRPSKAEVAVDGKALGKARDFDSVRQPLWLKPGKHVIELAREGYQTLRLELDLEGGHGYDVSYGLNKGSGLDGRSSERAETQGGGAAS